MQYLLHKHQNVVVYIVLLMLISFIDLFVGKCLDRFDEKSKKEGWKPLNKYLCANVKNVKWLHNSFVSIGLVLILFFVDLQSKTWKFLSY